MDIIIIIIYSYYWLFFCFVFVYFGQNIMYLNVLCMYVCMHICIECIEKKKQQ